MRIARKALTFDDVLLVPAHSEVVPREVSLATRLTRQIHLNLPLMLVTVRQKRNGFLELGRPTTCGSR